jgi:arylsulfatase A-like enzyme
LYPREHGAHGMLDSGPWFDGFPPARPLGYEFTTLAEVFNENGYFTAGIVSNFAQLQPGYKLNQGFQIYDYYKSIGWVYAAMPHKPLLHSIGFATDFKNKYSLSYRKAEDINYAAYALLERCASTPFFLFLNYMDAHDPYRPSRPFKGRFQHYPFSLYREARSFFQLESAEALCAQEKPLYEGALAYLDYQLGIFFGRLKQMGIYDESLIIVTSDHGELFCEHGLRTHRVPLYEGVLRVPLYVKLPHNQENGKKLQLITLADLYPTILSICGWPDYGEISGKPFGNTAGPAMAEFYNYDIGAHRALYDGTYKFMQFEKGQEAKLYDLQADPLETTNMASISPAITASMKNTLAAWVQSHPPRYKAGEQKKIEVSPSIKEDLKSLGYIQ